MTNRERTKSCEKELPNPTHPVLRHNNSQYIRLQSRLLTEDRVSYTDSKINSNCLKETHQKTEEIQCFPQIKDLNRNPESLAEQNQLSMIVNTKRRYSSGKWPNCKHKLEQYKLSNKDRMYMWTNNHWKFPFDQDFDVFDDLTSFDLMYVVTICNLKSPQ